MMYVFEEIRDFAANVDIGYTCECFGSCLIDLETL